MAGTRLVRVSVLLGAILGSAAWSRAADEMTFSDPVVAKLNEKVLRFLESLSQGNGNDAFDDLLTGSQLAEQVGAVNGLVDKSKEIVDRYGAYRESEAISAKRVGKDVVLLKYLFKCEKFPVVWYVTYYRDFSRTSGTPDDHWVVIALRFDTQLDALTN